jgi:1,2-phenylacetyl-CoA epoxidase PaaB subunit
VPKKLTQWEVYRPIKGSPGAFIGVVEAPDETAALKAAIEEFGIVNPEHQKWLFVRRVPGDDD